MNGKIHLGVFLETSILLGLIVIGFPPTSDRDGAPNGANFWVKF
jgi:hypothetical protein